MTAQTPAILDQLINRDALPFVLTELGLTEIIEVGCYRGEFAAHLCTHATLQVITVDPWLDFEPEEYLDGCAAEEPMDWHQKAAMERLKPWVQSGQCQVWWMTSKEAAGKVEDGSIGCVYIDANHSFEHATEDIALWWPKVKRGGILGLHDCYERSDQFQRCGVWPAVWNFAHQINQRPRLTPCTSAWFIKP